MSSQSENQTPLDILAASILIYRYYSIDTFDHLIKSYFFQKTGNVKKETFSDQASPWQREKD